MITNGLMAVGAGLAVGLAGIGAAISEGGIGEAVMQRLTHDEISMGRGMTMIAIGESAVMYGFTVAIFIIFML